ncbi:MAG: hypothetical protein HY794_01625 [Desulfarculus sp.]|nr:hypothetical protein [Desulfarculus sp.]
MTPGIQIIDPEERFCLHLEGAQIFLRRLDSHSQRAMERRHQGAGQRASMTDDVLDYVILDWQGVMSPLGGAEVPCTRDNKLKLPSAVKLKVLTASQAPRAEDLPG